MKSIFLRLGKADYVAGISVLSPTDMTKPEFCLSMSLHGSSFKTTAEKNKKYTLEHICLKGEISEFIKESTLAQGSLQSPTLI